MNARTLEKVQRRVTELRRKGDMLHDVERGQLQALMWVLELVYEEELADELQHLWAADFTKHS